MAGRLRSFVVQIVLTEYTNGVLVSEMNNGVRCGYAELNERLMTRQQQKAPAGNGRGFRMVLNHSVASELNRSPLHASAKKVLHLRPKGYELFLVLSVWAPIKYFMQFLHLVLNALAVVLMIWIIRILRTR
jgi:hypothetical protein